MAKRHQEHQSLSEVLKDFVTNNKLEKGLDKVAVRDVWENVMGPAIHKYTQDIKLDRETLYIQLTSSVLREELSYGKEKIIANLNETLGKELIKKLVLR
ncbi:DUF721 domain-containing protein [Aquimarina sp. AD10]|uniref:RNA-binding protein n=1 Tax=Aquimarina aggregata TaxID=1642818 RepID=A0A162X7V1_9FLAO|nr:MULTISPECIES: DUF721 domain-containing protein [Aquimarina]AXT60463.1 DUF721 domain-containing protein [Aquimarina sp. AD10]KZS38473.1 RNA-binding protein [Aquimarina aggregata]RKM96948.1 DUF721 domain-containing protein [Aquimarina sp. AD10]